MLTDGNSAAVQNCEYNLGLNGCKANVQLPAAPSDAQSATQVSFCSLCLAVSKHTVP